MYEENARLVWEKYSEQLSGSLAGLWCVLSTEPLGNTACSALAKSAAALGYGDAACTFVAHAKELSAHDAFTILEGIDPLCVVIADEASAQTIAEAYGQAIPFNTHLRLFGRDAVSFRSFEALLTSAENKQKAWAVLKLLPRAC